VRKIFLTGDLIQTHEARWKVQRAMSGAKQKAATPVKRDG